MGWNVARTRNYLILGFAVLVIIIFYNIMPVYRCKNVDRKSEWYVNDIYMSDQYYYENLLNSNEKAAYKIIFDGLVKMKSQMSINTTNCDMSKVWNALICDHPELINVSTYTYRTGSGYIEMYPKYLTTSKLRLRNMERKVRREIGKVVNKSKGKSEFEKEKIIYEYLGKNNAYGQTLSNSDQSAYTVFSFSNTVCAGYGKAAQILFENCGIESKVNINSNHMWNSVKIDGEYYYFDATCSGTMYDLDGIYKNISYMGLNQNKNTSAYNLLYPDVMPKITGKKYIYYDYYGLTLTYNEKNLSEIKKRIDECEYNKLQIKFTNPGDALTGLEKNANKLGLKNIYSYSGYCQGNGVITLEKK